MEKDALFARKPSALIAFTSTKDHCSSGDIPVRIAQWRSMEKNTLREKLKELGNQITGKE